MPRFKMLGGRCDVDGKQYVYREGKTKIVETDKPLDEMFKNQWERLDGDTRVPVDHRDTADHSGGKVTDDLVVHKKKVKSRQQAVVEEEGEDREVADLSVKRPRKVARRTEEDYDLTERRQKAAEMDKDDEDQTDMEEDEDLEDEEDSGGVEDLADEESDDESDDEGGGEDDGGTEEVLGDGSEETLGTEKPKKMKAKAPAPAPKKMKMKKKKK